MTEKVLITGGAGFIGSHLADALISMGHNVTVLDILHQQIHGATRQTPTYLNPQVNLIVDDIRDESAVRTVLDQSTFVFHFAAYTGVSQSMHQIREHLDVNIQGTAVLLELLSHRPRSIKRFILASSRAIYGEGAYECQKCGIVSPKIRTINQLQTGNWSVSCPSCLGSVKPIPTPEDFPPKPRSIYAVSKNTQEQMTMLVSESYGVPVVVLRLFNVYGPRQSLKNPYTGVISTFLTRLLNGKPPHVYEDGLESRDFVHVNDVVQACLLAMVKPKAIGEILNIGCGLPLTLLEVAQKISSIVDGPDPIITHQFRVGDIRHCYADITRSRKFLGYNPKIPFEKGIIDLINQLVYFEWDDRTDLALRELKQHGLVSQASTGESRNKVE